jgi:hypothetical protein
MKNFIVIAAIVLMQAGNLPMYCGRDTIIREGDTAQRVLTFCGTPDEVNGSEWVYMVERIGTYQASYWFYLLFDDGVLISIERL